MRQMSSVSDLFDHSKLMCSKDSTWVCSLIYGHQCKVNGLLEGHLKAFTYIAIKYSLNLRLSEITFRMKNVTFLYALVVSAVKGLAG